MIRMCHKFRQQLLTYIVYIGFYYFLFLRHIYIKYLSHEMSETTERGKILHLDNFNIYHL